LIAAACDKLIVHPNVVNAADINEMTENMLYVEGSLLDRFLSGITRLQEVRSNRILLATNPPVRNEIINAVSAARATIGADIKILELQEPLIMKASVDCGGAGGEILGFDQFINQVEAHHNEFDVLVVSSPIETDDEGVKAYLERDGGVNIWGGVEAMLSKKATNRLNKPVFHAPIENSEFFKTYNEVVDPRKAAEMVSMCYVHCCLKGAHKAPIYGSGNLNGWHCLPKPDFMVTPTCLWGPPHKACHENGIPMIVVRENDTISDDTTILGLKDSINIYVGNYLEAAGAVLAMKQGISINSVDRPLEKTQILREKP